MQKNQRALQDLDPPKADMNKTLGSGWGRESDSGRREGI